MNPPAKRQSPLKRAGLLNKRDYGKSIAGSACNAEFNCCVFILEQKYFYAITRF
jgi:hypothetical protein